MVGQCKDKTISPRLLDKQYICERKEVSSILNDTSISNFLNQLLSAEVVPMKYKWLRAVNYDKNTGFFTSIYIIFVFLRMPFDLS
jgi:hypothetical protein